MEHSFLVRNSSNQQFKAGVSNRENTQTVQRKLQKMITMTSSTASSLTIYKTTKTSLKINPFRASLSRIIPSNGGTQLTKMSKSTTLASEAEGTDRGELMGLLEKLKDGGNVVIAEGYMWELERRGYLQFGRYGPEVVLDHPTILKSLHEEFAHAGSDVIEAFTVGKMSENLSSAAVVIGALRAKIIGHKRVQNYYGYRERLKHFGREDDVEQLNRTALRIARGVADDMDKLMAGNLSNTPMYDPEDRSMDQKISEMFQEQIEWAVAEKADYIIGETFDAYGEAKLALDAILKHGNGCPAVITLTAYAPDRTVDEVPIPEACRRLEDAGAAVVGLNCARGPSVMMPLLRKIRDACKGPIAALPVPYRTRPECCTFQAVTDPITGEYLYPDNLDAVRNSRADIRKFAEEAKDLGIQYIGLCCGNAPILTREVAEVYGREPPSSKYKPDLSMSFVFGETSKDYKTEKLRKFMMGEIK